MLGVFLTFLIYEGYALYTKEVKYPTLSRTIWRITSWQIKAGNLTSRPLRVIMFIFLSWVTIHLSFGECAFGLC